MAHGPAFIQGVSPAADEALGGFGHRGIVSTFAGPNKSPTLLLSVIFTDAFISKKVFQLAFRKTVFKFHKGRVPCSSNRID